MSTIAPSPALTSRVTPRSTKKSWKSPKSPYLGHAKRSPKASANFHNVPSTPPLRPRKNKGNYSTTPNPKALIDRLSPSTYTGTQGATEPPLSPTKWLDTLMQSEALTAMLSSGKDVPDDASGDMNHDAVKQPSVSAGDMRTVCVLRFNLLQLTLLFWFDVGRRNSHFTAVSECSTRGSTTHVSGVIYISSRCR
jgi:hypothetical protein